MVSRRKDWLILLAGVLLTIVVCSVILAENSLRIWRRPAPDPAVADRVAKPAGAGWRNVEITAADGVPLRGWFFVPRQPNGSAVILLHGVADSRQGVQGQAAFLLKRGFTVLTPDSRGHGVSGGSLITYGIVEAGDVHCWADWLLRQPGVQKLYGLGESLGAAILLESLQIEPRFRAIVAECPFATFEEVAFDRLAQLSGLPKPALWPFVRTAQAYVRSRYGLDLRQASPAAAVAHTRVPILLIHGDRDENIPIRHSRELRALNPGVITFWEVPGAPHVGALFTATDEYVCRVVDWFTRDQVKLPCEFFRGRRSGCRANGAGGRPPGSLRDCRVAPLRDRSLARARARPRAIRTYGWVCICRGFRNSPTPCGRPRDLRA
jgi:pimeloyl-ACP methyl ester carboxylesterase